MGQSKFYPGQSEFYPGHLDELTSVVEGVVEVEAVTCCAGDAACPIAVASALERAPILTVTDDDDWDNGGQLFIAILMKQMHFMLCKHCHTARNGTCSEAY